MGFLKSSFFNFLFSTIFIFTFCLDAFSINPFEVYDCANQTTSPIVNTSQCYALLHLYNSTGGDNWNTKSDWLDNNTSVCNWYGITCSSSGDEPKVIQKIILSNNNLTGSIPFELTAISSLKRLVLPFNNITGISNLRYPNLTHLNLRQNKITALLAGFSYGIEELTSLWFLDVSDNELESLPDAIGTLDTLNGLNIWGNKITHLPSTMPSGLKSLVYIFAHNNQLTSLPENIGEFEKLKIIDLEDNKLTTLPDSFTQISTDKNGESALTELTLKNNPINSLPADIGKMNAIQNLDLDNDGIQNHIEDTNKNFNYDDDDDDNDGIPNYLDSVSDDDDGDGVNNNIDNCPLAPNPDQRDVDQDNIGDICDSLDDRLQDDEEEDTPNNEDENKDSDGDGISDADEIAAGSNPHDRGSFIQTLGTTVCSEWNGFLGGMLNIMEHVNLGDKPLSIESMVYSITGSLVDSHSVSSGANKLAPGAQTDVLIHDSPGRINDSYGKVCSTHSGQAGDLDGRMVYYKPKSDNSGEFEFAFAMPFSNGVKGKQYVSFNTYQPSLNAEDINNGIANWIQLTNLEDSPESGELAFYDLGGNLLGKEKVSISPGARRDFVGHQFGPSMVGMIEWNPKNKNAKFGLRNVRYFYDTSGFSGNSFATAFQLEGAAGNGSPLAVPLDVRDGSSILEISNTTNSKIEVEIEIYDLTGFIFDTVIELDAHSSHHLITDSLFSKRLLAHNLYNSQGIAIIDSKTPESVIATVMQYGRDENLKLKYLYGIQAREAFGKTLRGSYNTFLDQGCSLLLTSPSNLIENATISMTRSDGTVVVNKEPVSIYPGRITNYDLCSKEIPDTYGVVTVVSENKNVIVGTVVRQGKDDQYRFPTPLR